MNQIVQNDCYNIDVTVRIIDVKDTKDCVRMCKDNCFIPKKLLQEKIIDHNKDSYKTVFEYLETKCHSEMEKMSLKFRSKSELYQYYYEFKSQEKIEPDKVTIDNLIPIVRLLDPNNEKIKDISIYKLNDVTIYTYDSSTGEGTDFEYQNGLLKPLREKLDSSVNSPHYLTKLLIFLSGK